MNDQNTQTRKLSKDELTVALSGWRQEDSVATLLMGKLLRATVGIMLGRTNELLVERFIHLVGDMKVGSTRICKLLGAIV